MEQPKSLVERLDVAARHLRLVAEALGHLGGKNVWFVVSRSAQSSMSPPISQGTCIDKAGAARISAEGLSRIVDQTRAAVVEARKVIGNEPATGGRKTARARARK